MPQFAYNIPKIANTNYIFFKLNCKYYSCISYKKNVDPYSKSKIAYKLAKKLE